MMMPSIYNNGLFDEFFDGFFAEPSRRAPEKRRFDLMKTDIKELENAFELHIDMPGVSKEDVKAQIVDGYLVVSAITNTEKEEKDEQGKYIRRERYSGSMSRKYYVGDLIDQNDIKAKFEDGILKLTIPKEEPKKDPEPKYISIEG
ncbi:MAG: Hsp20/alpha crystallin family protein [Firmicutes bacterium]|nr:Hsp20/alpha crystallin family protein [Bacillota bacterium]